MYHTKYFYDEWACAFNAICKTYPVSQGYAIAWRDRDGVEWFEIYDEGEVTKLSSIDEVLQVNGWTFEEMEQIALGK